MDKSYVASETQEEMKVGKKLGAPKKPKNRCVNLTSFQHGPSETSIIATWLEWTWTGKNNS